MCFCFHLSFFPWPSSRLLIAVVFAHHAPTRIFTDVAQLAPWKAGARACKGGCLQPHMRDLEAVQLLSPPRHLDGPRIPRREEHLRPPRLRECLAASCHLFKTESPNATRQLVASFPNPSALIGSCHLSRPTGRLHGVPRPAAGRHWGALGGAGSAGSPSWLWPSSRSWAGGPWTEPRVRPVGPPALLSCRVFAGSAPCCPGSQGEPSLTLTSAVLSPVTTAPARGLVSMSLARFGGRVLLG